MTDFPILYTFREERAAAERAGLPMSVPWEVIAPHEKQALRNHAQSLHRLAERGGLGVCEMAAVLEDREWHSMSKEEAVAVIRRFLP